MRCKAGRRKGASPPHDGFTSRMHPSRARRAIRCPVCKSTDVVSVEDTYVRNEAKRGKCYCFPVPHPHRKGAHRLCLDHPLAAVPLTEDEQRQAMDVANNKHRTSNT